MEAELEINGVPFDVEYDYQGEEPPVMYYPDGSGYPGCPASLDVTDVKHKETSFFELFEENNIIEEVERLLWEHLNN